MDYEEIVFVERLPEKVTAGRRPGTGRHAEAAKAMQGNPGTWALFARTKNASNAAGTVQRYGKGTAGFVPTGDFEFAYRRTDDGDYGIYGRYVGS